MSISNKTDVYRTAIAARREQQGLVVEDIGWVTCLNCEHWREDKCKLYQAVPPPRVIVHGCASYEEKIPF